MPLIQIPTYASQVAKIRQRILAQNKNISTLPGSVAGDLFVVPQALSDVQQYAVIYYDSASSSVTELLALKQDTATLSLIAAALNLAVSDVLSDISASLDVLGNNVGLPRAQPKPAVGAVLLGRTDPPTADLTVPVNTVVRSSAGVQYQTTATTTMYAAVAGTYFNTEEQLFAISVPVQAIVPGSAGNAPAGTVTNIVTPVNGLPLVTNLVDMDGGWDLETDEAYGPRILAKWQAVGATTQAGIATAVTSNTLVTSDYLAVAGDPLATRGLGTADLFIKESAEQQFTETFSGFNSSLFSDGIRPSNLPVVNLVSITSGSAFLSKDTASALAGSVRAQDAFRFTSSPTFPVTITYTQDARVAQAQNVFNDPTKAPTNYQAPTTDLAAISTPILVKAAPMVLTDYVTTVTVQPGYVKSQVVSSIQSVLAAYSNSLTLGQEVFLADLNQMVEQVQGVLRVAGVATKFSPSNSSGVLSSVKPNANAYVVLNNVSIF